MQGRWQARRGRVDRERVREAGGGDAHCTWTSLPFTFQATDGNSVLSHRGATLGTLAQPRHGQVHGEQVGICSMPLIACRTRHPCGELGFLCVCVCKHVSVWREVFISVYSMGILVWHLSAFSQSVSQLLGAFTLWLQAGFTGRSLLQAGLPH